MVCNICHKRSVEKQVDCFEGLLKDKDEHIQMHQSESANPISCEFISVYEKISSKERRTMTLVTRRFTYGCNNFYDRDQICLQSLSRKGLNKLAILIKMGT